MRVVPVGNRVLAKRLDSETVTPAGLIIPDSAKKKQEQLEVIAVGSGKADETMPVSVGDLILVDKYSGQEVTIGDDTLLIINVDNIVAIVVK